MYVGLMMLHRAAGQLGVQTRCCAFAFEIAHDLGLFGIPLDIKTIYRLCMRLGQQGFYTATDQFSRDDRAETRSLLVCIGWGVCGKGAQAGRRPAGQNAKAIIRLAEPTQLVLQWLNEQGRKCNETLPIYDATMADIDGVFSCWNPMGPIGAGNADFVIFCATALDDTGRVFKRWPEAEDQRHAEIIDYTHAKQNLWLLAEQLPKSWVSKNRQAFFKNGKPALEGKLKEIYDQIRQLISASQPPTALKKFKNYFLANSTRMQYAAFRHLDLPTGSAVWKCIRRD